MSKQKDEVLQDGGVVPTELLSDLSGRHYNDERAIISETLTDRRDWTKSSKPQKIGETEAETLE